MSGSYGQGHQASWQNLDEYGRAQRYHDGVPQYEQSSIDHLTHSFARSSLDDQSSFYHPHSTQPVAPLSSSHPLHSSDASAQYQKDPTVQAIPAPQLKTSYDAPVFQTFQDRKRAKEAAWRAQQTAQTRPSPPAVIAIPPAISREWTPPFSTIAMMGQPGGVQPPLPPSRSNSVSPLPRSPSIPTPTRSPLPTPPPSITPPGGTAGPLRPVPPTIVQPIQATLERSDTVSSVKSLDRMDFSPNGRRPLPRTPVAVNSSKSLDRGLPSKGIDKRDGRRQQPSIVIEEDEDALSQSGYTSSRPVVIGKEIDNPYPPPPTPPPVRMELPDIVATQSNRSPAKFTPLPSFKLPEGDSDDDLREPPRSSPTVALRELPLISVSSNEAGPSTAPTTIQSPGSAIICAGCGNLIIGRIVNAMNQRFHPQCFRCNECGEYLEHVSSYEWHGKAYCHLDYHDKFANHCYHCKTPIVDDRFVTLDDPTLGIRYYHELHFFCSECGDPFLDPSKSSAPGTNRSGEGDEEGETSPFVIQKGHPYCEKCHLRLHKPKCRACKKPIPDIALNALGAQWHKECFVCTSCSREFPNNLFFPRDGAALCTECWEQTV